MSKSLASSSLKALAWAAALITALALSGCASVDPAPFGKFAEGLRTLRQGADAQATTDVAKERSQLVADVKADPGMVELLQLSFSSDFTASYPQSDGGTAPLYVELKRFQAGLNALNDAMIGYADALVSLAGDSTINQGTFEQMTKDLNTSAGSAAKALKVELPTGEQSLLSVGAVRLFQAYIENKRKRKLVLAIKEVQPNVRAYSDAARFAVKFLATETKKFYAEDQFPPLISSDAPDADAILTLNEKTESTLATLEAMATSYGRMPAAHADLAKAAKNRQKGLAGLLSFTDEAIRLRAEVLTLGKQNAAIATPTEGG